MVPDRFRIVDKRHDMSSILSEAGVTAGGDLWQVTSDSQRTVYSIVSVHVDSIEDRVILFASSQMTFNLKEPVFVRINHKSLIFKLLPGEFKVSNEKLSAKFPREGKALEYRLEPRFTLPLKTELTVVMRPGVLSTLNHIEGTIIDISSKGVGIAVKERFRNNIFKESTFTITSIAGLPMTDSFTCKVVSMPGRVFGIRNGEFKVGIFFSDSLSNEVIQQIRSGLASGS